MTGRRPVGGDGRRGAPKLPQLLHGLLLPETYRDDQLGDLEEAFGERQRCLGRAAAVRWYWRQAIRSAAPAIALRLRAWGGARVHARAERKGSTSMGTTLQDLRYGLRSLIKSPGFAVVSVVTLALAIAVNSAIFSLVNVIVFSDLPMEDPATVVMFRANNPRLGVEDRSRAFSYPDYLDFREQSRSFEQLAAMASDHWVLSGSDEPMRVDGLRVTANFADAWRLTAAAGRTFLPEEDRPGAPRVALLSHGFWSRHFGARPEVIGSSIRLDGAEYTVVGVLSPKMEFANLAEIEVYLPMALDRANSSRDGRHISITGRLRPGVPVEEADREISIIASRLAQEYPTTNRGWEPAVLTARDSLLDDESETVVMLLVLTVGFVLLIACANVANMLLARATARGREMAVRAALGASRLRLVRQMLTESLVIAAGSAAIGLALSRALMGGLVWITAGRQPIFQMAVLDENVVAFTVVLSIAAPLVFGLIPAMRASAGGVGAALKEGGVRASGREGNRARSMLVGAQVALALMLMVVAGLMTRTVVALQQREMGFEPAGLLSLRLDLPENKYGDDGRVRQFFQAALDRVRGSPAVDGAALVSTRPAVDYGTIRVFEIEGRPQPEDAEPFTARTSLVSIGYFDLLRIPLVRGRVVAAEDTEASMPVAVIGREAAERYWPGEDPVGRRIRIGDARATDWIRVVGVVGDVRGPEDTEQPVPYVYFPFRQRPRSDMRLLVRGAGDAANLAAPVRSAIWGVDPDQPVDDVETMEQVLYDFASSSYALIALFTAFAAFALCMAAVGIYGVMSYAVSQRAGEISIRMALGAKAEQVRMMILGQGARLVVFGSAAGLLGAVLISRMLGSVVFGINALDPLTFLAVPAVLVTVGLLANYLPARRATRVNPIQALRAE